jgi:hypothetical protein
MTDGSSPWPTGLCDRCQFALLNRTRRGTIYLRCGAASDDPRLPKYPTLPVLTCPAFRARDTATPG